MIINHVIQSLNTIFTIDINDVSHILEVVVQSHKHTLKKFNLTMQI